MAQEEYKYPSNIIEITKEFIDSCGLEAMRLPTIEGLALKLDVDTDTLVEWAKIHEDFNKVYKQLKMAQKEQCMNGGAFGGKEVNASMFIFLLKANHGMIETSHLDMTTGGKPIPILEANALPTNNSNQETPETK